MSSSPSIHSDHNWETMNEQLQEPVPFEDFKFSFGLDPEFSIPIPFDIPVPPVSTIPTHPFNAASLSSASSLSSSSSSSSLSSSSSSSLSSAAPLALTDPMLSEEMFPFDTFFTSHPAPPPPPPQFNSVLDEQDQKAFSSFLDSFFMDQLPIHADTNNTNTSTATAATSMFETPGQPYFIQPEQEDLEEQRRNSILQSLDHQKQKLHERLNLLNTAATASSAHANKELKSRKRSSSGGGRTTTTEGHTKKSKHHHQHPHSHHRSHHKELLTEEEKRANHIASEQKRRSTIRNGFKELTDIIPTLKNINNSKSTVLFKAVDFIKYLDRRNKSLRDKAHQLELRLQVQGRKPTSSAILSSTSPVASSLSSPRHSSSITSLSSPLSSSSPPSLLISPLPIEKKPSLPPLPNTSKPMLSTSSATYGLPPSVSAALMAHKSQQEQLLQLQEQLQLHQRLLTRQQEVKEKAMQNLTSVTLAPLRNHHHLHQQQQRQQHDRPRKTGFRAVIPPSNVSPKEKKEASFFNATPLST